MGEVENRSHWVPGLDRSLHFGKGLLEVEVGLEDWVQAGAFDVGDLADLLVVEEVQDLALPVLLDQPLFRRKDCLGHVQWKVELGKGQRVVVVHQCRLGEDCLLWPRAHGEDGRFPHHICQIVRKERRMSMT